MTTVYGSTNCLGCRNTKRYLDTKGIEYNYFDIQRDSVALAEVTALGYAGVPVVVDSQGNHWQGFDLDRLKGLTDG